MAYNIIWLPENSKLEKIYQYDVICLEANGNYTNVFFNNKNNTKKIYTVQLGKIEPQLNKATFLRVHRSFIVNITYIEFISLSKLECKLVGIEKMIPIGKEFESFLGIFLNTFNFSNNQLGFSYNKLQLSYKLTFS